MKGEGTARRALTEQRMRSEGVLSPPEVSRMRDAGRALAYDPVQQGWAPADAIDDLRPYAKGSRAHPHMARHNAIALDYGFRAWRDDDLPLYRAMLNDPKVWQYMLENYPDPLTDDIAKALIEVSNSGTHHMVRAVLCEGEPIGQARLQFGIAGQKDVAEISYWLGREHWGKGHASRFLPVFAERALADHPHLSRLVARVHPENAASERVLRKAGFSPARQQQDGDGWLLLERLA